MPSLLVSLPLPPHSMPILGTLVSQRTGYFERSLVVVSYHNFLPQLLKVNPGQPLHLRSLENQVMLLIISLERCFLPHRITPQRLDQ